MRKQFFKLSAAVVTDLTILSFFWHPAVYFFLLIGPVILLGLVDMSQKRQTIRRNFPVVGHGRYLMEMIRPEINQYFIESNTDGMPFNRERRSVVYQRAKGDLDTLPFGTQWDVYANDYEWINHSLYPKPIHKVWSPGSESGGERSNGNGQLAQSDPSRVRIGGPGCRQFYEASVFNISAMSYGSLSKNAILALNEGARRGGFFHNTGEGGISPYHLKPGGDLVWQIGTAYFGCRDDQGKFSPEKFRKKAETPQVKMIEIKISQGAKPGHGGILPAKKLTPEIVAIRDVTP